VIVWILQLYIQKEHKKGNKMKTVTIISLSIITSSLVYGGFDFGGSSGGCEGGSGDFQQQIANYAGDYEKTTTVGTIPKDLKNVKISLKSDKDVDIRLYDANGKKIVHWPNGILNGAGKDSTNYNGVTVEYSGYNGDGTGLGHEYIKLSGTTKNDFIMKAFGYKAGYAKVDYSWAGKANCSDSSTPSESGSGDFQQQILSKNIVKVGDIQADNELRNDFRAIEAAGHAYAARDGQYRSLSFVELTEDKFRFTLEMPMAVGTVGGLTSLHPLSKISLRLLGKPNAKELMRIIVTAGLANNFSAVKSLVTKGIQQGHMKMHLLNILNQLQATEDEKKKAKKYFSKRVVSFQGVVDFVESLRV